jgi:predicted nucleic acid-binding Zn ribbon protein
VIPFSEIMEAALKKLDIHTSPFIDDLAENWSSIVPPAIAKLTRPGKWENNILYVYVPSSTHLFELRRTALHQIEEAVRAFAGTTLVRQVRLMVEVRGEVR